MYGYIYKITNIITNKIYIGRTRKTIQERFLAHCYAAQQNKAKRLKIQNSIRKYGSENFTIELVYECQDEAEYATKEQEYIKLYNSTDPNIGYNVHEGGDGGSKIAGFSQEQRAELSKKFSERNKKCHWYNNGVVETYKPDCPSGFVKGRLPAMREHLNKVGKPKAKRIWINNGVSESLIYASDQVPAGYNKGRLKEHTLKVNKSKKPAWNKGISNLRCKGGVWINNGVERRQVQKSDLKYWFDKGYHLGMYK